MQFGKINFIRLVFAATLFAGVCLRAQDSAKTLAQKQAPATSPQVREVLPSYEGQTVASVEIAGRPNWTSNG